MCNLKYYVNGENESMISKLIQYLTIPDIAMLLKLNQDGRYGRLKDGLYTTLKGWLAIIFREQSSIT